MALIALGAICCTVGGGIVSYFAFGNSESNSENTISAEGAINHYCKRCSRQDRIGKSSCDHSVFPLCN